MKPSVKCLEYQPLEPISLVPTQTTIRKSLRLSIQKLWQSFCLRVYNYLASAQELKVWQTRDRKGNVWWSAYNPRTQQSIHYLSEDEMRIWIEQHY
jgi:hypothetical protein